MDFVVIVISIIFVIVISIIFVIWLFFIFIPGGGYEKIDNEKNYNKNNINHKDTLCDNKNDVNNECYIKYDIEQLDVMEGHQFEYACAEILKQYGFKNVTVTKGSKDFGVDIVAYKDGINYAFQCKRYSNKLGNKPIQEVIGGLAYYGCTKGVVMTNQYFTESARELAKSNNIILWDRLMLSHMLKFSLILHDLNSNISFSDLQNILTYLGFEVHIKGEHYIYTKKNICEIINIQPKENKVKTYQINQIKNIINSYFIRM